MYGVGRVGGLDHDDEHYVCWRCAWFGIFVGGSQCMSQSDSQCPTVASIYYYSRTCLGRPPLLLSKSGRSRQVVSHNRSDTNHVLPMCTFNTAKQ